jgi:multidrug efflux pump subunit AcrA (membrane-fusion protein)
VSASPFGVLVNVLVQQQRQAACLAQRRAQWEESNARQKAAKAADDEKQADLAGAARAHAQAQEQAKAQAAANAHAAQKKARSEQRRVAEEKRQRAMALMQAENAPDNHCRDPQLAKAVIDGWNGLDAMKASDTRTIDIEHVTTVAFRPETMSFACHGVFVTSKGWKIAGTVTVKKNIANESMFVWERDRDQDLAVYEPPPVDASSPEMGSQSKIVGSTAAVTQANAPSALH